MIRSLLKSLLSLILFSSITAFAMDDTQSIEAEAVKAFTELVRSMRERENQTYSNEEIAQIEQTIITHKEHIDKPIEGAPCLFHAVASGQHHIVRQLIFHGAAVNPLKIIKTLDQDTHPLSLCRREDIESFTAILQADINAEQTVNNIMRYSRYHGSTAYPLHGIMMEIDSTDQNDTLPTDRVHTILKDKLCWLMLHGADPRLTYPRPSWHQDKDMFHFAQQLTNKKDKKDVIAILNKNTTDEKSYYRKFMITIDHDVQPLDKKQDNCVIS